MITSPRKYPTRSEIKKVVRDPKRLAAVHKTGLLDTKPESQFDNLTRRASSLLDAPLALITLVDEYRDYVKSQVGLEKRYADKQEITAGPSFCQLTVAQDEPVIIRDVRTVPTLRLFPSVLLRGVRAHLGIPLRIDGHPIGNLCVIDYKPRNWTPEQVTALEEIASEALILMRRDSSDTI